MYEQGVVCGGVPVGSGRITIKIRHSSCLAGESRHVTSRGKCHDVPMVAVANQFARDVHVYMRSCPAEQERTTRKRWSRRTNPCCWAGIALLF